MSIEHESYRDESSRLLGDLEIIYIDGFKWACYLLVALGGLVAFYPIINRIGDLLSLPTGGEKFSATTANLLGFIIVLIGICIFVACKKIDRRLSYISELAMKERHEKDANK